MTSFPYWLACSTASGRLHVTIHKPLHEGLVVAHLRGELTLGAYALDTESNGRFLVLDADTGEEWQRFIAVCEQLSARVSGYAQVGRGTVVARPAVKKKHEYVNEL